MHTAQKIKLPRRKHAKPRHLQNSEKQIEYCRLIELNLVVGKKQSRFFYAVTRFLDNIRYFHDYQQGQQEKKLHSFWLRYLSYIRWSGRTLRACSAKRRVTLKQADIHQ